ncbi:hypothetical protein Taro_037056 [Colocasia esculenta]|uniref:RING-type domain-containing protein n=1 Tax=Colocasia esculenta TaxID=4460 RepID=A0A843WNJ1_COLES|nr:hypothetical protein [Colocasia esculenta]
MLGSGMNLVTTVIGFGMSATFIVFVCARLICGRTRSADSRASAATSPLDPELRSELQQPERTIHGLEPVVVAAFPTVSYNKETFSSRGDPQCSICLAEYEEKETLRIMPTCGHNFHVACIDVWLLKQSTCPVCRLPLPDSSGSKDASASLYGEVPQIVDASEVSINRSHNWLPHRNEQSQGSRNTLEIDGAVHIDMETIRTGLTEHC